MVVRLRCENHCIVLTVLTVPSPHCGGQVLRDVWAPVVTPDVLSGADSFGWSLEQ